MAVEIFEWRTTTAPPLNTIVLLFYMCSLLASLNTHAAFVVFQLSLVTLSQHASGLHLITATRVTGWWQLRSSTEMHMLGRCQWPTTHWEAPTVTFSNDASLGPGTCSPPFKKSPLTFILISTDTLSFHLGTVAVWFNGLVLLGNCQTWNVASFLLPQGISYFWTLPLLRRVLEYANTT